MSDTLDRAAETAAKALATLLESMSKMITQMTELMYKGGLGFGRLAESAMEGAETIYLGLTTIDTPPPKDKTATSFFLNGEYYAYLHYNEGMYRRDLMEEEPGLSAMKDTLDELKDNKEYKGEDNSLLRGEDEDIRKELAIATKTRDENEPGTDEYDDEDKEVVRIQGILNSVLENHDKNIDYLRSQRLEEVANEFFPELGRPLTLDQTIGRLEMMYKHKEKRVSKFRKRYKWSKDAKAQYTSRLDDEIARISGEIAEIKDAPAGTGLFGAKVLSPSQENAIKILEEKLAKYNKDKKAITGEKKKADDKLERAEKMLGDKKKDDKKVVDRAQDEGL